MRKCDEHLDVAYMYAQCLCVCGGGGGGGGGELSFIYIIYLCIHENPPKILKLKDFEPQKMV